MKGAWVFVVGAVCGVAVMALPKIATHLHGAFHGNHGAPSGTDKTRAHTEERFAFTAKAPIDRVWPLFGAEKERVWAPNWNPHFLHPVPANDEEGMVFTVAHDHTRSAWVNTQFDEKNGHIQYVYMIPDALVTVITLQLTAEGEQTRVEVEYDRTALSPEADAHVKQMAVGDRTSAPEWEKQVNDYFAKGGVR